MRKCVYVWVLACAACSSPEQQAPIVVKQTGGAAGSGGEAGFAGSGGSGIAGSAGTIAIDPPSDGGSARARKSCHPPPGFTQTEIGGYQARPTALERRWRDAGVETGNESCGNVLLGVVRDFRGQKRAERTPGLRRSALRQRHHAQSRVRDARHRPEAGLRLAVRRGPREPGTDLPVWSGDDDPERTSTNGIATRPNVNQPFIVHLWFAPQPNGLFTFQSLFFFPLDNAGFGNSGNRKGRRTAQLQLHDRAPHALPVQRRRDLPVRGRRRRVGVHQRPARRRPRRPSPESDWLVDLDASAQPARDREPATSTTSTCFTPSDTRPSRRSASTRTSRS